MQQMDVRLKRKGDEDGKFTIGIECTDKQAVSKSDIEKFRSDKVKNKFFRSIFISSHPIKGILDTDNSANTIEDELWLVTQDPVFLAAAMKVYLSSVATDEPSKFDKGFDNILDTYSRWQNSKKSLIEMDKSILRLLELTPDFENQLRGHVYLVTKSNAKKGQAPY